MNAIIICPSERPEASALSETSPLVCLPVLGKPFIHYWVEYLVGCDVKELKILAVDRPDQVRAAVGDGARWGLRIEVVPESEELTPEEAQAKYHEADPANWFAGSAYIAIADHFPGFPNQNIFVSYAAFFTALQEWLAKTNGATQIGVRQIRPGIWVGLRTQISPDATVNAPCWIGENVLIKSGAEVGPFAIVENGVVIERGATIVESWVGRHTFVGELIQIKGSFASGNLLINMASASATRIPDPFLLCGLKDKSVPNPCVNLLARVAALAVFFFTLPFALATICRSKLFGLQAFRARQAAAPHFATGTSHVIYYEFANSNRWWRRWPQLWNIARGEFTWIGNRPLTPLEAGNLTSEFERLWLAAPIGLVSQADAEGCFESWSDEARAHASFYAAQANWRLDTRIFLRALKRLAQQKAVTPAPAPAPDFKSRPVTLAP